GSVRLGPRRVVVVGGPPGTGKTALAMQWTTDALRQDPALSALVVNVEMPAEALLERILARLSGVPRELSAERQGGTDAPRGGGWAVGCATRERFAPRLGSPCPPFDWGRIAVAVNAHRPGLLVLDYLQRITPTDKADSERAAVSASMVRIRQAADAGLGVLA